MVDMLREFARYTQTDDRSLTIRSKESCRQYQKMVYGRHKVDSRHI